MNVTVYTTGPACHKCNLTKSALAKKGIAFEEVRIDRDVELAEKLRARGFSVAPVVHRDDTDEWWGDFRIDRIRALIQDARSAA